MLNENMKAIRKAKGLSQQELAIKLNVVRQTISKWEQGLSVPDSDMLIAISEVLETPVSTLLGEKVIAAEADDLKAISAKLEVINLQLAQRKTTRRRVLHGLLISLCAVIAVVFAFLLMQKSPYLDWDYSDPETAVLGVAFHSFEWLFVRVAPIILVGAIAGVGGCKVEPVWDGPGTVKVVVISSSFGICSEYLIKRIQEAAVPTEEGSGYGFAPIDHTVTVESVEAVKVNVVTKISYMSGYSWSSIGMAVKEKIAEYLKSIAAEWKNGDETTKSTIYVSKLQAAVLDVEGVVDISGTTLNGSSANLVLNWNQIPVLGEVTA